MKLLCVVPSYWPAFQYGGPITSIHNLNRALAKKGIVLTVYTTNAGLDKKVPINQEVDVDGVKVTYFAFTKFFEFLGATGWQFSHSMSRALRENVGGFDLIYIASIWNYSVAAASHYCRKYKKPYIISPKGLLYPYTAGKRWWKKLPYYHLVAKRDLKNATAIHYTSEHEAEECHSYLGLNNQAIVIPNGIDLSEFNGLPAKGNLCECYPVLKDKKVILFLSRINWKKGLDILVKAYAMLAKERSDVHLLIVGNDERGYIKKVKGWIKDYELGKKVTFTGILTGKKKLEAFAGSDLFVLSSYSENFGMVIVEAMACGLPAVISNKVGIYKEIEKNKAGVIVNTNAESVYNGMKQILENSELKKEIAINGRRLAEKYYDIDKVAEKMIKVYKETLEN